CPAGLIVGEQLRGWLSRPFAAVRAIVCREVRESDRRSGEERIPHLATLAEVIGPELGPCRQSSNDLSRQAGRENAGVVEAHPCRNDPVLVLRSRLVMETQVR